MFVSILLALKQSRHDNFDDRCRLLKNIMIPKAQHFKLMCHQPLSALCIVNLIVHVLTTIKLDNQSFFKTNKINNVIAYWYLSLKFKSEPICSKMIPKMLCNISAVFSSIASTLSQRRFFRFPLPSPRPEKNIIILLKFLAPESGPRRLRSISR